MDPAPLTVPEVVLPLDAVLLLLLLLLLPQAVAPSASAPRDAARSRRVFTVAWIFVLMGLDGRTARPEPCYAAVSGL